MSTKIFVNLPVKDLEKSKAFFVALGWTINKQFTDETAASMVISDDIYAMLLTHQKYNQFTSKKIADTSKTSQVLVALSVDSKADVNRIADAALKAGGRQVNPPQDYGFMQLRSFEDLDGHHWEVLYMDPAHVQPQ
ncbi:MAG: VOC family protein [Hyphomonadaceae bacterium]|nr:VOC family protein [Hyphomonadaceae bacterium]